MIKHISFDLWLTLIKSNPLFKKRRAEYFCRNHNPHSKNQEWVEAIIKQVDTETNELNEITGNSIPCEEMYLRVLTGLGNDRKTYASGVWDIVSTCNSIFLMYPPSLYDESTAIVLKKLINKGLTFSITSNTGFIGGATVNIALTQLLYKEVPFAFKLYSDIEHTSKPSPKIFEKLVLLSGVERSEILHVGDNIIADIAGARKAGIGSIVINNPLFPENSIKTLLNGKIITS